MISEKTKLKWLTKLYKWTRGELKQAHLHVHYNDMMCPNCKEWFSLSGALHNHERIGVDLELLNDCEKITCGQCGNESYWVWGIIPAYMRVDERGDII